MSKKLLKANRKKVKNYVQYLKKILKADGTSLKHIRSMSDDDILERFRKCCDCGDVFFSKDQQMHVILEFDTPERVFEVLYEDSNLELDPELLPDESETKSNADEIKQIDFSFDELDSCGEECTGDHGFLDEICSDCLDIIFRHMKNENKETEIEETDEECICEECEPVEDLDEEFIRGQWILEGSTSLNEIIDNVEEFVQYLKLLKDEGYELQFPVEDDCGFLSKQE